MKKTKYFGENLEFANNKSSHMKYLKDVFYGKRKVPKEKQISKKN